MGIKAMLTLFLIMNMVCVCVFVQLSIVRQFPNNSLNPIPRNSLFIVKMTAIENTYVRVLFGGFVFQTDKMHLYGIPCTKFHSTRFERKPSYHHS